MPSNIAYVARSRVARIVAVGLIGVSCGSPAGVCTAQPAGHAGPPALLDNMDGASPVLRVLGDSRSVRVLRQSIDRGGQHNQAAEHVALTAPPGESAQLGYALPAATVLDELQLAAVVWCNRPGVQLAALVVLPRSVDPETGSPRRLLVRSNTPAGPAAWQTLTLERLPEALSANARVARARHGAALDERGAYVTDLVLLAPGGPGPTALWVDQISLRGALRPTPKTSAATELALQPPANVPATDSATVAGRPRPPAAPPRRPPLPRIIQWQGEPFQLLRGLGFDAVAMGRLPTAEELAEAERLGMLLVCPPPALEGPRAAELGPEYNPVLAWDMGALGDAGEVTAAEQRIQAVRRLDPIVARPLVLRPEGMPLVASRMADLLLLARPTVGSTLSSTEYAAWLTGQRRLARPGAAAWIAVDTHWGRGHMSQLAALRGGSPSATPASVDELSLAVTAAFGALPRGFWFQSQASLAAAGPETRMRALALELTNLRLGLIEPWLAAGRGATTARSSRPDVTAMVLTVERSHLLVPMRWPASASPGVATNSEPISFLLPGVPESSDAYLLTIAGPRRLETRRVAGGLRLSVDAMPDDGFILLTEDGYAFSHVNRYLREHAARAAQARVELAALNRSQAVRAAALAPPALLQQSGVAKELALVDAQLTAVNQTLRGQDYASAFARAAAADRLLDKLAERAAAAMWPDFQLGVSPLPLRWSVLPALGRVAAAVSAAKGETTPLAGGEFEDLNQLLADGWRRLESPSDTVTTAVRLSPIAPVAGAYCLELEAQSTVQTGDPPALAAAPVWVTSPPLAVPEGQLLEVTGWARVEQTPIGSADPLLVFDSIGGEESAIRIASAPSWTPFRMLRVSPGGGECRVTIALGGVGKVQVDSLHYRLIPLRQDGVVAGASIFSQAR